MIGYPLLLQPRYDEKIWGGRRLATVLGKSLPPESLVGESLESGDEAIVTNGPLAGQTIGQLVADQPMALLGERGIAASKPFGDFPLLAKFIDASEVLSLQVHPDDKAAAARNKRGKTEAWHVIQADPGATLIVGLERELSPEQVREAIASGTFEEHIVYQPVRAGDTLFVQDGTLHAIGAGVLLYEIQENSDVTYRFYDWGRVDSQGLPRDLHLDDALQVLEPARRAALVAPLRLDPSREFLVACHYFALERLAVAGELVLGASCGQTFRLLSCIDGECRMRIGNDDWMLAVGESVLLPADCSSLTLDGGAVLLCASIPDLRCDVVEPLLHVGYTADEIACLDGGSGALHAAIEQALH